MGLLQTVVNIEGAIGAWFNRALGRRRGLEPLEIVQAVVADTEREIQSGTRARRVFPFNAITVSVIAASDTDRARIESVFGDGSALRDRIVDRLRSAGCEIDGLAVSIVPLKRAHMDWMHPEYHIDFERLAESPGARQNADGRLRVKLTVLDGVAEHRAYAFTTPRIDVGRCLEVRDNRNRLIRTNHVAFTDQSGSTNQTVSRRHAHITCDAASHDVRVHDDGSEHGTGVVRDGRTIPVPHGGRGVRLQSGDEIVFGEARLRIAFEGNGHVAP